MTLEAVFLSPEDLGAELCTIVQLIL
jgi:hypothetical protein